MSRPQNDLRRFSSAGIDLKGVSSKLMLAASLAIISAVTISSMPSEGGEINSPKIIQDLQLELDNELGSGHTLIAYPGLDIEKAFADLGNTELSIMFGGIDSIPEMSEYFRGDAGVFDTGNITKDQFERFHLYRQLASAFYGSSVSENERTAFAAMASLRAGAPVELLQVVAAKAELDTLTGVSNPISHVVLQHVMQACNDDIIKNLPEFSLKDVHSLSAPFGNTSRQYAVPEEFGAAIRKSVTNEAFYIPVQEGVVAGNFASWLWSANKIPEVSRILELRSYLYDRNTTGKQYSRFSSDPEESAIQIARLAQAGDTVARDLAPAFGIKQDFRYSPISRIHDLPSSSEIGGQPITFNRDGLYVYTGKKGEAFFAVTRDHSLVLIAKPDGSHDTFYEASGHDATYEVPEIQKVGFRS